LYTSPYSLVALPHQRRFFGLAIATCIISHAALRLTLVMFEVILGQDFLTFSDFIVFHQLLVQLTVTRILSDNVGSYTLKTTVFCDVAPWKLAGVSEEFTASIFRAIALKLLM
jgi:hypothetical protein